MSSKITRSYSINIPNRINKFYQTSFQPLSYYSSNPSQLTDRNIRPLKKIDQSESKENYDDINDKYNINMEIFRSNIKKNKPSPFYIHKKSLRLKEEIDWINKLIHCKTNLNVKKLLRINPSYLKIADDLIEKEKEEREREIEKDISEYMINEIRIENLNKIIKINNRLKNNRNSLLNKRGIDNYNYKNFMYEMNKFKNNGINKWKNDFRRKFSEY